MLSGIYQSEVTNNQSTIGIIEKGGSILNPFSKWTFVHQSGGYTAQVSASTATKTTSELIAEEQTYNVDVEMELSVTRLNDIFSFS